MLSVSILNEKFHSMNTKKNKIEKPQEKTVDKAGIGQTDEEKGIAPETIRKQKKKELVEQGKAKKKPAYRAEDDETSLQVEA
jgi:hypothetical protein